MNGKNGGGFYARYRFDQNRGTGFIELLIEYPEGTVVPLALCKNLCKIADDKNEGIATASPKVPEELKTYISLELQKGKKMKEIVPQVEDAILYSSKQDYGQFIKYERPDFKIPMQIIWKSIIEHWECLPIVGWRKEVALDDIYQELIVAGENKAEVNKNFNDPFAVYLTRKEIEDVAYDYGIDFNSIRSLFEARGLWVKDKGAKGYQYSKKVDRKKQHFYKLRKIAEITSLDVNTEFCLEYREN